MCACVCVCMRASVSHLRKYWFIRSTWLITNQVNLFTNLCLNDAFKIMVLNVQAQSFFLFSFSYHFIAFDLYGKQVSLQFFRCFEFNTRKSNENFLEIVIITECFETCIYCDSIFVEVALLLVGNSVFLAVWFVRFIHKLASDPTRWLYICFNLFFCHATLSWKLFSANGS